MKIKKVYVGGPLFTNKEKEELAEIDKVLRDAGYETFLPTRDGLLCVEIIKKLQEDGCSFEEASMLSLKLVTYLDIYQVCESCDAAVISLNGRVPDEGAVSEAAICFRSNKPLVFYKDDYRTLFENKDNPLLTGRTELQVVKKIEDIPAELKRLEGLSKSSFNKIIEDAKTLFTDYDSNNKDLKKLAELGRKIFLTN